MPIAKPPISPDVAEVIGTYAEKVENRSLLLEKFIIHKSWPEDDVLRNKLDDAVRWSFIRCAENGEYILSTERKKQYAVSNGRNTKPEKKDEADQKIKILDNLTPCDCRKLSAGIEELRKESVDRLVDLIGRSSFGHRILFGRLESRLAVNLSGSLVQNAGICLDRLFGVPYLPGSAVKGVCRHVALEDLRAGKLSLADFQDIFGTADIDFKESTSRAKGGELEAFRDQIGRDGIVENKKGCIDFLAAFPRNEAHLMVDMTNVHFSDYYKSGNETDLRKERPMPNPFPVVEKGAEFAFCIALNSMGGRLESDDRRNELLEKTSNLLRRAMEVAGFGAKTGAGYGWFVDETERIKRQKEADDKAREVRKSAAEAQELRRREEDATIAEATELLESLESAETLVSDTREKLDEMERRISGIGRPDVVSLQDRLNVQRNRIPPESFGDILRRMQPNQIVGQYVVPFGKLDEIKQFSLVEFFRSDKVGRDLWIAVHNDKKLSKKCNSAQAVHAFLNSKGLPKISASPL